MARKEVRRPVITTLQKKCISPPTRAPAQLAGQPFLHAIPTIEDIAVRRKIEKINHNRVCVINHPSNLADVLFCEPIARMYYEDGYKIIWTVDSKFFNLNKHFPYIAFVNKELLNIHHDHKEFYNTDNMLVVPLQWAGFIMGDQHPSSKYKLFGLSVDSWKAAQWKRDHHAEKELFNDILQLEGTSYNLINDVQVTPPNNLHNIHMERISDYSMLDWCKVIENATNVYTTNGFMNYVLPKLEKQPNNVVYYPGHVEIGS